MEVGRGERWGHCLTGLSSAHPLSTSFPAPLLLPPLASASCKKGPKALQTSCLKQKAVLPQRWGARTVTAAHCTLCLAVSCPAPFWQPFCAVAAFLQKWAGYETMCLVVQCWHRPSLLTVQTSGESCDRYFFLTCATQDVLDRWAGHRVLHVELVLLSNYVM